MNRYDFIGFNTFDPIYPLGPLAQPDQDEGGDYCLELRTSSGSTLHSQCFSLYFGNREIALPGNEAYFVRVLPHLPEVKEIALTHNGDILGILRVSKVAPSVRLLAPNGGEIWPSAGTFTVSWEASDSDGDLLSYALYYSPDNGVTWSPVALDVEGTEYNLDVSVFRGSNYARLKVVVSDGFLFGEDISDAPFQVTPKAPRVQITRPLSGTVVYPNTSLLLEGYATDIEDGEIPDDHLVWTSNLDGSLGTGRWVIVRGLRVGQNVITLRAVDSNDHVAITSINLLVTYEVYLPLILRNR